MATAATAHEEMTKQSNHNGNGYGNSVWAEIRTEWDAGQISVADMCKAYGPSPQAIRKHAKRHNWPERGNLVEQVRKKVEVELLSSEVVDGVPPPGAAGIVESAAKRGVGVVLRHRKIISRLLGIAETTLTELEDMQVISLDLYKKRNAKNLALLVASVAKAKMEGMRTVAQVVNQAIPLERQAYSLDADGGQERPVVYEAPDYKKPRGAGLSEEDWDRDD
jgi:hypothetical protein